MLNKTDKRVSKQASKPMNQTSILTGGTQWNVQSLQSGIHNTLALQVTEASVLKAHQYQFVTQITILTCPLFYLPSFLFCYQTECLPSQFILLLSVIFSSLSNYSETEIQRGHGTLGKIIENRAGKRQSPNHEVIQCPYRPLKFGGFTFKVMGSHQRI